MSNVKEGDLAIAISGPRSAGRICRVIRKIKNGEVVTATDGTDIYVEVGEKIKWHIDGLTWRGGSDGISRLVPIASDAQLRPIRDNPGNESFFKAAPIEQPKKVTA